MNSTKLSFCIPSLNRPEFLLNAIQSISDQVTINDKVEICVYNNCSDSAYLIVEDFISKLLNVNIVYCKGIVRLEIDQSMHEVVKMATGEYVFLLGDDDFLLGNGLKSIIELLNKNDFDLIIFNALILNEKNKTKTRMFESENLVLNDLKEVLLNFKNYCSYGNIVLKSYLLKSDDFISLFGTSHAYGCFWLEFFRKYEKGLQPKVLISNSEVVCLRAIIKTYDMLRVTFEHSQKEFELYYKLIGLNSKRILKQYDDRFWINQSRFVILLRYKMAGNNLLLIKSYNSSFYRTHYFKIKLAIYSGTLLMPFKGIFKFIFFKIKKRKC